VGPDLENLDPKIKELLLKGQDADPIVSKAHILDDEDDQMRENLLLDKIMIDMKGAEVAEEVKAADSEEGYDENGIEQLEDFLKD
jgi:hypothetical protein